MSRADKPEPHRLDLGSYGFIADIASRFGDVDSLRHLNNVALARIYEEGRVQLHRAMELESAREKGSRTVVAQVTLRYLGEGFYPSVLRVGGAIARIGGSSYQIAQGLFQEGACIGTCDSVLVYTREGRPAPLPAPLRDQLAGFEFGEG